MISFIVLVLLFVVSSCRHLPPEDSDIGHPLDESDFARAKTLHQRFFLLPDNESESCQYDDTRHPKERIALIDPNTRWPGGRVPYTISRRFDEEQRAVIASAIARYDEVTCIRFEPREADDRDYVHIHPGHGCSSQVGLIGGRQTVHLGRGCFRLKTIEHELMHVLGFKHEHERPDRDEYIRINWENIEERHKHNFDLLTWDEVESLGEEYDYGSIMHYSEHAFSKNRLPTMTQLTEFGPRIGKARDFSPVDIRKINKLYDCDGGE